MTISHFLNCLSFVRLVTRRKLVRTLSEYFTEKTFPPLILNSQPALLFLPPQPGYTSPVSAVSISLDWVYYMLVVSLIEYLIVTKPWLMTDALEYSSNLDNTKRLVSSVRNVRLLHIEGIRSIYRSHKWLPHHLIGWTDINLEISRWMQNT